MRVVHLNVHARFGGAGKAARRLHDALRAAGMDSHMVVHSGDADRPDVHPPPSSPGLTLSSLCRRADRWPLRLFPDRDARPFSPGWMPGTAAGRARQLEPDVVHAHWLGGGFVRPRALAGLDVPIVWTLHDMWPFTGGCHYSGGCRRYRDACGACPRLGSGREHDLSRLGWWLRRRALEEERRLIAVAPSRWLAARARESSLLGKRRVEVVPNGLDLKTYRPLSTEDCRTSLGLPADATLVTFGAADGTTDPRKGVGALRDALRSLAASGRGGDVELVIFGGGDADRSPRLGLPVHRLGYLDDEQDVVRAYNASDLFVAPSLEDNQPNTVMESLACGTPVVAFEVGGIPEMVETGVHGELVPPGDSGRLTESIARLASSEERRAAMSRAARRVAAERYSVQEQADRYRGLYREALS